VRSLLDPLKGLAERTGAAVILVNHLTKKKGVGLYRSIGSISIIGMARAAWAFARCPRRDAYRVMVPLKNNLTPVAEGIAYKIADGAVAWDDGSLELTAHEAFDAKPEMREANALKRAVEWLGEFLKDGEWKPRPEIEAASKAEGISWRTLRRAKEELKLELQHTSNDAPWEWRISPKEKMARYLRERGFGQVNLDPYF
jgi:hypothetical protein